MMAKKKKSKYKKKKSKYTEVVGKRSVFGHIAKWLFWGFNALMVIWIWGGLDATVGKEGSLDTAESIGVGLGITMLLILWVIGDLILGMIYFFTRPTRSFVKE